MLIPSSIDVRNAKHRMKEYLEKLSWDDAFEKVSFNFDLTAEEMEELEKLVPYKTENIKKSCLPTSYLLKTLLPLPRSRVFLLLHWFNN